MSENVELKRKSYGKVLTVGLDKLSAADRKWLDDQANAGADDEPVPDIHFKVETPDITVTAEKLAADFVANKAEAERKYRGNVRVEGVIHGIRTEELGGLKFNHIQLKAGPNRIVECGVTVYWTKFSPTRKPGHKVAIVGCLVSLKSDKPLVVTLSGANFVKLK